jgi:ABC-2 type transport system ATP-binding protein
LKLDLNRPVRRLSKGNKQKLGIVQAFMHRPELLMLDEPTSGLDPLMQQEFLSMVCEAKGRGQTRFLSSHVISEIAHAADEIGFLLGSIATTSGFGAIA